MDPATATAVQQLISSLGFPIFVCCYLLYRDGKKDAAHKDEVDKLTLAVNSNTQVMQRLLDRLEGGDTL